MVSLIIPTYNEEAIIEETINRVHEYLERGGFEHEIIVADNGSTDSTLRICCDLASARPWLRPVHTEERGVGRAFVAAVEAARFEYIVCLDADLSSQLEFIDYACHLLKFSEFVIGSKAMGNQVRSLLRILGSQLYVACSQLLFQLPISDFSPDAKAFRRSAIFDVLPHLDRWTAYIFELALYFRNRGKKVIQVGIECTDNRPSKFNLIHEGLYRYAHLARYFWVQRDKTSWLHRA